MKTYLLLRSNKQSGPYSFDELLTLGLRAQDLLWAEGKSASWRYPSEMDEFRGHVPAPVTESMGENQAETMQVEVAELKPATEAMSTPLPDRESFHFHPRIRATAPPLAETDSFHFHPLINGAATTGQAAEGEPEIFPTLSLFMKASAEKPETASQGIVSGEDIIPDFTTAAFQPAKPPADGEDEIPSLALQAAPENTSRVPEAPKPVTTLPRINVTLPAAVADKTMVIIQRKEQSREKAAAISPEPMQEIRTRPVLEFLDDPGAADMEPAPELVAVEQAPPAMEAAPELVAAEQAPVVMETAPELVAVEQAPPAMETAPVETEPPASDPADPGSLAEPAGMEAALEPTGDVYAYPVPSVKQGDRTGLLQKIAVAAAIVSLLSVAALIANSVFNPDAYNYQSKTKPAVPAKSLPAKPASLETPAAEATVEANRPGTGDSDKAADPASRNSPSDNHAKPAVRKIE